MLRRILRVAVLASTAASAAFAQSAQTPKTAVRSGTVTRLHFVVAPTGNEARYRVREQLVSFDLPNDAVGLTKEITGMLVVDANGSIVRDSSRITVNVSNLKSDKERRDGFIKRRTM